MAKASIPGAVKTRLVPPFSYAEAALFNSACLTDVAASLAAAAACAPIDLFLAHDGACGAHLVAPLLPPGFRLLPPRESGLGRSLHHAARDLLAMGYGGFCLVNSDSPTLPPHLAAEAAHLLGLPGDRIVLGPSADGGYYLIGCKASHPRLFSQIDWSTERVLSQTIARAEEIGVPVVRLREWYDVDDGDSLALLAAELFGRGANPRGFAAPATLRCLDKIAATNGELRRLIGLDRA